jgi:signal transduction histidine kinase
VLNLYRIIQEALTNTIRHAQAARFSVTINHAPSGGLNMRIEDDGIGMGRDGAAEGLGLANMRKRAAKLGAALDITEGEGGRGTVIGLRID